MGGNLLPSHHYSSSDAFMIQAIKKFISVLIENGDVIRIGLFTAHLMSDELSSLS